jgi:DUSP domain
MRDFGEIFGLGSGYFNPRGSTLSRSDFLNDVSNVVIKFSDYEACKFTITAMLGLRTINDEVQKQAILSVLNYNPNIEVYIQEHLDTEDTFFVVNKHFWDSWTANVGFDGNSNRLSVKKEEKIKTIDNASLVENLHSQRLKEVQYGVDFILVPRFVFFPLSKWFACNKVIERKVISYKQDKNKSLNLYKQKKLTSSQNGQS